MASSRLDLFRSRHFSSSWDYGGFKKGHLACFISCAKKEIKYSQTNNTQEELKISPLPPSWHYQLYDLDITFQTKTFWQWFHCKYLKRGIFQQLISFLEQYELPPTQHKLHKMLLQMANRKSQSVPTWTMLCSTFINTFVPDFIVNELHLISNKRKSWGEELIFHVSPCFHEHVTSFAIFLKQEIVNRNFMPSAFRNWSFHLKRFPNFLPSVHFWHRKHLRKWQKK